MAESRVKNASRNFLYAALNKVVSLLLPFVTRTIIIYLLGSSFLGLSTLFTSVLSFLSLAELGLGVAIVHSMYKPIAENDTDLICALLAYYRHFYHCIGATILVIGTLMLPFLPYLIKGSAPDGVNIYVLFYIYLLNSVLSYFLVGYKQSLLTAHQRSDVTSKISIIVQFVMQISQIAVLCITRNYYVYAFLPIISTLTINLMNALITRKMFPRYTCRGKLSREEKTRIQKKLGGLVGTKLNSVVIHSADALIVSAFLGLVDTAMYGNYYYIVNAVSGFIVLFFSSMTAGIGNCIVTETVEKNYRLFNKLSLLNSWGVGWCCVCLICLYHPFMVLWVGEELSYPFSVELCFVLYFFIYNIQRVILMFKDAAGLWYEDRMRPYVAMTINVILNLILVQHIGVYGIILSSVFALLVSVPWANYTLFKMLFRKSHLDNIFYMLKDSGIIIINSAITYFICGLLGNGIVPFIEKILICSFIPHLVFYLFYRKNDAFGEVVQMQQQFLPSRLRRLIRK